MACEPPTLKCTRPSSPHASLMDSQSMAASSIFSLCRYWEATCGSVSIWRFRASFRRGLA